jgi:hypothetical protein
LEDDLVFLGVSPGGKGNRERQTEERNFHPPIQAECPWGHKKDDP